MSIVNSIYINIYISPYQWVQYLNEYIYLFIICLHITLSLNIIRKNINIAYTICLSYDNHRSYINVIWLPCMIIYIQMLIYKPNNLMSFFFVSCNQFVCSRFHTTIYWIEWIVLYFTFPHTLVTLVGHKNDSAQRHCHFVQSGDK